MLRDNPFRTSSTLLQKVRESINNREPPSKNNQDKGVYLRQKKSSVFMQDPAHNRHGIFSRPSLQQIPRYPQHVHNNGIYSCKEIEDPIEQYFPNRPGNNRNPSKTKDIRLRQDKRSLGSLLQREGSCETVLKTAQQLSKDSKGEELFRFEDFEDQLNEFLKDKHNARQLLALIDGNNQANIEYLHSQPIKNPDPPPKMIPSQDFNRRDQPEDCIDFDALREEELQYIQPDVDNDLIVQMFPLVGSIRPEPQQVAIQDYQPKLFLLDKGEVTMYRYFLSS